MYIFITKIIVFYVLQIIEQYIYLHNKNNCLWFHSQSFSLSWQGMSSRMQTPPYYHLTYSFHVSAESFSVYSSLKDIFTENLPQPQFIRIIVYLMMATEWQYLIFCCFGLLNNPLRDNQRILWVDKTSTISDSTQNHTVE